MNIAQLNPDQRTAEPPPSHPLLLQVPNALTMARIVAAPGVVGLVIWARPLALVAAAGLVLLLAVTDGLDGWLARRWRVTSQLGAWLDPLADKVLVTALVISLSWLLSPLGLVESLHDIRQATLPARRALADQGIPLWTYVAGLPWWLATVMLGREVLVTAWRHQHRGVAQGTFAMARTWGKVKTAAQLIWAITTLLAVGLAPWFAHAQRSWLGALSLTALTVALVSSYWSAWDYLRPGRAAATSTTRQGSSSCATGQGPHATTSDESQTHP